MEDPRQYLNDVEEGMRLAFEGWQSKMWTAMPAIVESVDLEAMTVNAVIPIQGRMANPDGTISWVTIGNGAIQDIPIVFPSAGGFTITMPITQDDEILVVFASRCIDAWWQSGGIQKPLEYRMHDLSDGFCIPGPKSQPNVLPSISATDMQIRNKAGTQYISLTAAGLFKMQNSAMSLKTLLTTLNNALVAFATSAAAASSVSQVATAAATLETALAAVTTDIGELLA